MAESKMWAKVGVWAYVIGIVIAVLVAVFTTQLETWSIAVLAVLGIIVGLLNITGKEVKLFLLASIAFVVAASQMGYVFNAVSFFGRDTLVRLTQAIVVFTAPGALVVAFKALYKVAKSD